jgi:pSer/pThr/pTyr-binding forkhead associated (FHA) protein
MKCPLCNKDFPLDDTIPRCAPCCGEVFSEAIREQLQKQLDTPLHHLNPPPVSEVPLPEPSRQPAASDKNLDPFVPSSDPGAASKIDGREDKEIRGAVGDQPGLDVSENTDIRSGDISLAVNSGNAYYMGEGGELEFKLKNISSENLNNICITGRFARSEKEWDIPFFKRRLVPGEQSQPLYLQFSPYENFKEVSVYIRVVYEDIRENPSISIYMGQMLVSFNRKEGHQGDEKINVICNIDVPKNIGGDIKPHIEITGRSGGSYGEKQKGAERSLHDETTKKWLEVPLFFQEEETKLRRNEILIQKKMKEGSEQFRVAQRLWEEWKGRFPKDNQETRESLKKAMDAFIASETCYLKIREIDSDHEESLVRSREIGKYIEEAKRKHDDIPPKSITPDVKFTSCMLTLSQHGKTIFMYSKPVISIGKHSSNDIILRLQPYHPEEKYPENCRKNNLISRLQAEIVNHDGIFFLRDKGTDGQGSKNGTFLDERKVGRNEKDHPLRDGCRISVARVLDIGCKFLRNAGRTSKDLHPRKGCITVMGQDSDSCFGIDKQGAVNAIRLTRLNNLRENEEYLILIREVTLGRSARNGIVINKDNVSDIHAKIFYRDNRYWIEDLNSRHGTRVNGRMISSGVEFPLKKQSKIDIGGVSLDFIGRE